MSLVKPCTVHVAGQVVLDEVRHLDVPRLVARDDAAINTSRNNQRSHQPRDGSAVGICYGGSLRDDYP
jgi:hypothetical protein